MWQPCEDRELLELWPSHSASEIGRKLGRSRNAIIGRFHRINRTYNDKKMARARRESAEKTTSRRLKEVVVISEMKRRIAAGADRNSEIVRAFNAGAGQPAIGDVFGVTRQAISLIVRQNGVCGNRESV